MAPCGVGPRLPKGANAPITPLIGVGAVHDSVSGRR
jgi:hypothetical protein